jgi:energy-coupling factor transport system permease protein
MRSPSSLLYRPLASPLHAVRAGVAALWALALIAAALVLYHPLALAALVLAVACAMRAAGLGDELARPLRTALIIALPIVVINVLVSRQGLTVFARLGDLGPFGQGDLTVEALVYGAVIALKVTVLVLITALASLAIDPDALLRICRRLSFRSALTASLAVRMIPLLAADAQRLADAQRTRPMGVAERGRVARGVGGAERRRVARRAGVTDGRHLARGVEAAERSNITRGVGAAKRRHVARSVGVARTRAALLGAVLAGSLDRAMDVAATLEVRGFAAAPRAPRVRRPWSRHDLAFAASAAAVLALALLGRLTGLASFTAYPLLHIPLSAGLLLLCAALPLAVLLPFADRRGIDL